MISKGTRNIIILVTAIIASGFLSGFYISHLAHKEHKPSLGYVPYQVIEEGRKAGILAPNDYSITALGAGTDEYNKTVIIKREATVLLWNDMVITVVFPNVKPDLSEEEWAKIRHEIAIRLMIKDKFVHKLAEDMAK